MGPVAAQVFSLGSVHPLLGMGMQGRMSDPDAWFLVMLVIVGGLLTLVLCLVALIVSRARSRRQKADVREGMHLMSSY